MPDTFRSKIKAFLSIVMPVFNEEEIIEKVVDDYLAILGSFERGELVVVNDASTDRTLDILRKLARRDSRVKVVDNEFNLGHGRTLVKAFDVAQGEYVFHVDSDNQFFAEDFWRLWSELRKGKFDVVIGRRSKRQDPFARLILTLCLKTTLLILYHLWLQDPNSPFRIYSGPALKQMLPLLPPNSFLPSIGLSVAAYNRGYRVGWIDVRHVARTSGKSFLRSFKIFLLVFSSIGEMLELRRNLKRTPT